MFAQGGDGSWTYLPTAVDGASGTVAVRISGPAVLAVMVATQTLRDVPSRYWASLYIDRMLATGAMEGLPGGVFDPGGAVTRAQFVKMLVVALQTAPVKSGLTPFDDVPTQDWFAPYVAAALQAGIVQGVSATAFDPDAPITREAMAVLLARAFGLEGTKQVAFADAGTIGATSLPSVEAVVEAGYLSGFPGNLFEPQATATRAQAAKVLSGAIAGLAP